MKLYEILTEDQSLEEMNKSKQVKAEKPDKDLKSEKKKLINQPMKKESVEVDEAQPMGFMSKMGHKMASKLGSKSSAAALDVGNRANDIFNSFRDVAMRSGVDLKAVTAKDLTAWFKKQGLPAPNLGAPTLTYDLTNKQTIQDVFKGAAQKAFGASPAGAGQLGAKFGLTPADVASASGGTSSAGGGAAIKFADIKAALTKLSPRQKAALKAML